MIRRIRRVNSLPSHVLPTILCSMLTLASVGQSQVVEFEESFSGRGPFGIKGSPIETGLDSPDWSMLTNGGDLGFQDDGLAFHHLGVDGDDLDGTFVRFTRDVGGFDSFVERIEIRGVELGVERPLDEHPDASERHLLAA